MCFVFLQTFLGDFQKEQEKFVQEKKSKKSGMENKILLYNRWPT